MKKYAAKTYGKKGDEVVNMNLKAIDLGESKIELCENITLENSSDMLQKSSNDEYYKNFIEPIENLEEDEI